MLQKNFIKRSLTALTMTSALFLSAVSSAAVLYSNNFESLDASNANALSEDGWKVGAAIVNSSTNGDYDYCCFPSGNGSTFNSLVTDQGGAAQGTNQLSHYLDFNNSDYGDETAVITAFTFQDIGIIDGSLLGETITLSFDVKAGNRADPTTTRAYLKVLKQSDNSFGTIIDQGADTTGVGSDWTFGSTSFVVTGDMVGELLQVGLSNTAQGTGLGTSAPYAGTGMFYDNINVVDSTVVPVPAAVWLFGSGLLGLVGVARRRKA